MVKVEKVLRHVAVLSLKFKHRFQINVADRDWLIRLPQFNALCRYAQEFNQSLFGQPAFLKRHLRFIHYNPSGNAGRINLRHDHVTELGG